MERWYVAETHPQSEIRALDQAAAKILFQLKDCLGLHDFPP